MGRIRAMDPIEIRVLGCLMEKEQTTPASYPLTINAVIAACNQKTSRDPVTSLSETEVVEALDRLRKDVITWREDGVRVERWKHSVDRRWELDSARKAVMTVLLLRGPQTTGELKTRTDRLHGFASKEEVEEVLLGISEGIDALVENVGRLPGQRDERWRHIVGRPEDREDLPVAMRQNVVPPSSESVPKSVPSSSAVEPPSSALQEAESMSSTSTAAVEPSIRRDSVTDGRIAALEETVDALGDEIGELREELLALRQRLGDIG